TSVFHVSLLSFTTPSTPEISSLSLHDALPIFLLVDPAPGLGLGSAPALATRPAVLGAGDSDGGAFGRRHRASRAVGHRDARHRRSEEHTSELQSPCNLVCRLLLEKKKYMSKMR